jgi:hypothetical protein
MMSTEITTAFVKQFNSMLFHLSQQKGSRLQPHVRNETQKGKSQFFDRLGLVTATKKVSRHSDTPLIDTPHSRRRVTLSDYEHADLIDDADRVRLLIDPESSYAQSFMWAFGRAKDDEVFLAFDGAASGGEEGGTSVAHPNTQKVASVASAAGADLNVQAERRAKQKLDEAEVDPSISRYIAPDAEAIENLLSETEVTSADFNTVRALVMGEVDTFLGFKHVRSERNLLQSGTLEFDETSGVVGGGGGSGDADGYARIPCWAEDGMLLSLGQEIKTRISERDDKSYSTQVFASMTVGATRLEEEKVVMILCAR